MRATIRSLIILVLLSGSSNPAAAEFFGISLPDLIGPGPVYRDGPIEIDFDFGQEFEQVDNVLLMIEATVTPLVIQSCGSLNDPQSCERRVFNLGFLARLEGPQFNSTTTVLDGFRRDYPLKRSGVFGRAFVDFSFHHLTDGAGTLKVWWNGVLFLNPVLLEIEPQLDETAGDLGLSESGIRDSGTVLPTATITDAVLIIEATPIATQVPERWRARGWRRWGRHRH